MSTQQLILLVINIVGACRHRQLLLGLNAQRRFRRLWAACRRVSGPFIPFPCCCPRWLILPLSTSSFSGWYRPKRQSAGVSVIPFLRHFLMILIPSALWMPLTNVYVGNSSSSFGSGARSAGTGGARLDSAGMGASFPDQGYRGCLTGWPCPGVPILLSITHCWMPSSGRRCSSRGAPPINCR